MKILSVHIFQFIKFQCSYFLLLEFMPQRWPVFINIPYMLEKKVTLCSLGVKYSVYQFKFSSCSGLLNSHGFCERGFSVVLLFALCNDRRLVYFSL